MQSLRNLQITQNNSQNKYVVILIIILIISGISYGLIHNFIKNQWLFSVFLILIFAFAAMLRFVINIPTIYVIIFLLASISGLLFYKQTCRHYHVCNCRTVTASFTLHFHCKRCEYKRVGK